MSAEETWKGTVASVHADIGYAPAQAMLSAYGFYDGTIRDDICAPRTPGATVSQPSTFEDCVCLLLLYCPSAGCCALFFYPHAHTIDQLTCYNVFPSKGVEAVVLPPLLFGIPKAYSRRAGCFGSNPITCTCAGKAVLGVGAYPLSYCTFGAAVTEVELDALTGEQRILRSDILFDCGRSMNPALDMGQVSVGPPPEPALSRGHCDNLYKAFATPLIATPLLGWQKCVVIIMIPYFILVP